MRAKIPAHAAAAAVQANNYNSVQTPHRESQQKLMPREEPMKRNEHSYKKLQDSVRNLDSNRDLAPRRNESTLTDALRSRTGGFTISASMPVGITVASPSKVNQNYYSREYVEEL